MSSASIAAPASMISGGNATVFVTDMSRAVAFYTHTLGLKLLYRAGDHFAMVDAGRGLQIGLHPPAQSGGAPGTRGSIQIGLNTSDISAAVQALQSRGVTFTPALGNAPGGSPIRNDGSVKLAFFTDPDGNDLYLCEAKGC